MSVTTELKAYVNKEPDRVWYSWLVIALGLVLAGLGIAGTLVADSRGELFTLGPEPIISGFAIACMGIAEVLPVHRRALASRVRIASLCGFVLYGATIVVQVLSSDPVERYFFGGLFGISVATLVAYWMAFKIWG